MNIEQTVKATKREKIKPQEKDFSINWAVGKFVAVSALLLLSVMQVSAFFKDSTLEALEVSYKGSVIQYDKLVDNAHNAITAAITQHELRCSTNKALKAYKESKGYQLSDPTSNPCTQPLPFQVAEPSQPIQ